MSNWIRFHDEIRRGEHRGIPRALRFVFLELCLEARPGRGVVKLPLGMDLVAGVHDLLGGSRREVEATLELYTKGPGGVPSIRIEGEKGSLRLVIPSWEKWNPIDSSADRMRRLRENRALSAPCDASQAVTVTSPPCDARPSPDQRRGEEIREDPKHRDPATAGSEPPGSGPCPLGLEAQPQTAGPGSRQGEQPPDPEAPPPAPPPVAPLQLLPAEAPKPSPAELVFAAFLAGRQRVMPGTRPPRLDDKRRKLILARLRDFPLEDLIGAARGIWLSAWHLEDIPRRVSLELVLRDSVHVEKFRDIAARPELGRSSTPGVQQPAKPGEFDWKHPERYPHG